MAYDYATFYCTLPHLDPIDERGQGYNTVSSPGNARAHRFSKVLRKPLKLLCHFQKLSS